MNEDERQLLKGNHRGHKKLSQESARKNRGSRMDDTVIIEHDEHGRVERNYRYYECFGGGPHAWVKDGALRYRKDGWREVPKTKWVPGDYEIQRDGKTLVAWVNAPQDTYPMHFHLGNGYRWKTVEVEREVEG